MVIAFSQKLYYNLNCDVFVVIYIFMSMNTRENLKQWNLGECKLWNLKML